MFDRYNTIDEDDTRQAVKQLEVFFESVAQSVAQAENKDEKQKSESV